MECNTISIRTYNSKEKVCGTKNLDSAYSILNDYIIIEVYVY